MIDDPKVHYDLIGNEIKIGSVVVAPYYQGSLALCKVLRIAEKSLQLHRIGAREGNNFRRRPDGCMVVDEEGLTMYFLRKEKKK